MVEVHVNATGINAELGKTITSQNFSITLEGLDPAIASVTAGKNPITSGATSGWRIETVPDTVNGGTKDIVTFRGNGDEAAIVAAMDLLEIIPNSNVNSNNANDLAFTTTLTTYTPSGIEDAVSTSYSGAIEPVTDPVKVVESATDSFEDTLIHVKLDLGTSVDEPYVTLDPNELVDANKTVTITYNGVGDATVADFDVTLGATGIDANGNPIGGQLLHKGDTYTLAVSQMNDLTMVAAKNESGELNFSYTIESKEDNSAIGDIVTTNGTFKVNVEPVADGLKVSLPKAEGLEDTLIELTNGDGSPIQSGLIDGGGTTPEVLDTVIIHGVPQNYLVYVGGCRKSGTSSKHWWFWYFKLEYRCLKRYGTKDLD